MTRTMQEKITDMVSDVATSLGLELVASENSQNSNRAYHSNRTYWSFQRPESFHSYLRIAVNFSEHNLATFNASEGIFDNHAKILNAHEADDWLELISCIEKALIANLTPDTIKQ